MSIRIVDTTLRDGEQRAGLAFSTAKKVEIAKVLDACGVYQIEAGAPAVSKEELAAVREIKSLGLNAKISAWNRMREVDIAASLSCGVDVVHISVPTSVLHMTDKLRKDKFWLAEQMEQSIAYARSAGAEVTIGFEDASRTSLDFIVEMGARAKAAGASWLRFSDTVGVLTPQKAAAAISAIAQCGLPVGFHAHNDFGMAIANTVAAIGAGAQYVDTTIGGIGERTGNCDMVKLLDSLEVLMPTFTNSMDTKSTKMHIHSLSKLAHL